jgi:hypothetical protein
MTEDQLDVLEALVDTCDNYLALAGNKMMSGEMRADALRAGLALVREQIKLLYLEAGGVDEWLV